MKSLRLGIAGLLPAILWYKDTRNILGSLIFYVNFC